MSTSMNTTIEVLTCARIFPHLANRLSQASLHLFVASPYLGESAVARILELCPPDLPILCITVLDAANVRSGSTSLDAIRRLLDDPRADVRHNSRLHAKVYLIDKAHGYIGSANATTPGLSLEGRGNIEIMISSPASEELLNFADWLARASSPIQPDCVDRLEKSLDTRDSGDRGALVPRELPGLSFAHFPETSLTEWRSTAPNPEESAFDRKLVAEAHWLGFDPSVNLSEYWEDWPSVVHLKAILSSKAPCAFGELTDLFHDLLDDLPYPERQSLKKGLQQLLEWTLVLCPELLSVKHTEHTSVFELRD